MKYKSKRAVCIKVTNKQLNALENIITTKLSEKELIRLQPLALNVWRQLVKEYDWYESEER